MLFDDFAEDDEDDEDEEQEQSTVFVEEGIQPYHYIMAGVILSLLLTLLCGMWKTKCGKVSR